MRIILLLKASKKCFKDRKIVFKNFSWENSLNHLLSTVICEIHKNLLLRNLYFIDWFFSLKICLEICLPSIFAYPEKYFAPL